MVKGQGSRLVEGGEAEVEEDDKDEYRAPTWRAMIRITPVILGVLSRSFTASLPGYKSSNNAKNVT
jgi:hypothetical protein